MTEDKSTPWALRYAAVAAMVILIGFLLLSIYLSLNRP